MGKFIANVAVNFEGFGLFKANGRGNAEVLGNVQFRIDEITAFVPHWNDPFIIRSTYGKTVTDYQGVYCHIDASQYSEHEYWVGHYKITDEECFFEVEADNITEARKMAKKLIELAMISEVKLNRHRRSISSPFEAGTPMKVKSFKIKLQSVYEDTCGKKDTATA